MQGWLRGKVATGLTKAPRSQPIDAVYKFRYNELSMKLVHKKMLVHPPAGDTLRLTNPFLVTKDPNPRSKRFLRPAYSLRRQADLVKAARRSDTLHLLPPGPKLPPRLFGPLQRSEGTKAHFEKDQEGWRREVWWEGSVPYGVKAKKDVGRLSRVYAGRKRMFKGHKWERMKPKRAARTAVRMRNMAKRIRRFKELYARRRPSPLARPIATKRDRLPF